MIQKTKPETIADLVHMPVTFLGCKCIAYLEQYANGWAWAIELVTLDSNGKPYEPMATATFNSHDYMPVRGHVFIKGWSENEGMLQALQDAGIVGAVTRSIPAGFAVGEEAPVLVDSWRDWMVSH